MNAPWRWLAAIAGTSVVIVLVAYTGYVNSYLDHETQTTFFLKRYPTLQTKFHDPFANERDDEPIDQLPPIDRAHFVDYCKYRFGIVDRGTESLQECKTKIPSYLQ
ncbi:hypothetical protein R69927_03259 [Paraburkholderia domus]|jgi:hypothetical protein|uniref:Uncharacterized protein n=1 Tax=Paraburkholderia domus TaxID=2793075 RepID=A0A9N8MN51_9BURK|nr:hypothetical protein [Paraburkholderia domus]MBK5047156.1 hypothetical protein [Burkholderia sp. R-70006]MBK5059065.1 hypothetical protein [Burkholderia sp. R-70199]MBK5086079.1 hypothetical protein [Burkholderia sp. R-69927]MBK5119106.1 hypothetical protein [Burkholderia sp. R-69980]MBK5163149.1 hypothetical protein [Burkholderia sp. R-70211]MBK5178943.1 hypothetical protein [Burkholderia sp. R-69749]MCI0145226.1 hypothetical protein [Paraburkholderia sediminicola]